MIINIIQIKNRRACMPRIDLQMRIYKALSSWRYMYVYALSLYPQVLSGKLEAGIATV